MTPPFSSSSSSLIPAIGLRTGARMTTRFAAGVLTCLLFLGGRVNTFATATNELSEAEIEGRNLVQQILAQRPTENFTNTGVLKIRGVKGRRHQVGVEFQILQTATNVLGIYIARNFRGGTGSQTLTISQGGTAANGYLLRTDTGDSVRSQNLSITRHSQHQERNRQQSRAAQCKCIPVILTISSDSVIN